MRLHVIKKTAKRVFSGVMALTLAVGGMTILPKSAKAAVYAERGAYGVGEGKQIPDHIFAPFVDIVSYVSDSDYSSAGSLSLEKMYKDTGILYYNLGFIMATAGTGGITDGIVDWSWGGYSVLSEDTTNTWQLDGIKESINYIRSKGGDVIVSIGGLNEGNFFQVTQDEEILYNTYMDVIQGYGLTRLDLDIEGGGQGKSINVANAKALKRVQDETGVEIVLTLPVLPSGLTDLGLGTFEAYVENGVDVKMVNIMAMCYGDATLLAGETYATASVRAIDSLADQIKTTYQNNGVTLSDSEINNKIGVTVSIGFESASFPIWTTDYSQVVINKAIENNIGMTSFWCLNRDCQQYGENSGIYGMYEHTNVFKTFMGDNAYVVPDPSENNDYVVDGETIKEWKSTTSYIKGDKVIYDGKIWEAQWWTQGTTPGTAEVSGGEPWTYISDVEGTETTTTEAPTTAEPETEAPVVEQPVVPIGFECKNVSAGQFTVVMGNPGNGQTYNLYIDGQFKQNISLGEHVITGITEGTHTVKLTGVLNGLESEGVEVQVTIPGEVVTEAPTTQAPATETSAKVEINGYQISTVEEGFRTVYSIYDPDSEVVSAGMLYGIGTVTESDMTLEAKGSAVYDFVASDSGKMDVTFSQYESAQSYAMTMKFAKSVSFYTTKMSVRAYAKLSDGTYIYSDIKSYTVYKLADYLYQNLLMNSLDSHEYLYNSILSVVDSTYKVKDFAWNNSIVKPDDL